MESRLCCSLYFCASSCCAHNDGTRQGGVAATLDGEVCPRVNSICCFVWLDGGVYVDGLEQTTQHDVVRMLAF